MNPLELIKGLYQWYTIKPGANRLKPVIWMPKKPRLELAIDTSKSKPWKGIVWHHSATTDSLTLNDSKGIIQFHKSFRIEHVAVAAPVVNKAPGIQYIQYRNGEWYETAKYNKYMEEKKNPADRLFEDAWLDVGYHGMIEHVKDTMSFTWGRSLAISGAHAGYKEFNDNYLGLCAIGDYDTNVPHQDMWDFALMVTRSFMDAFIIPASQVIGHREVYVKMGVPVAKQCPGKNWSMDKFRGEL